MLCPKCGGKSKDKTIKDIEIVKYVAHKEGNKRERFFKCPVCNETFTEDEIRRIIKNTRQRRRQRK